MERMSKQLVLSTQSGRLKPDVRLGVAISEFAQTLDDDRKREFQNMQTAGTQLSGRDAIRLTEELNQDSERRHCTWRPYGTKCGRFLDRLQALANIGDVMIGGSQNVIATSIWCAVRLALQTATNFRGYFERLSSLFMKLGTSWELHHEFAQIFPQSEVLQTFLCEYLIVLMRLCRKTVIFSNKSFAGQLWSSLGASFDYEFKPLQEEMDKWGMLIQHKTQQLAAACVVDAEKFRRMDYKQRVLQLISPNQPQHVTTWRRHRRKGDCKWIYQSAAYKSWIADDASSTMCISGKLGSGKTVTMANLVARINLHQPCAFFFCTFKEPESLKATNVLGSIAFHLLDSIPGDKDTWDMLSGSEETATRLFTCTGIVDILIDLLPEEKKYVVIVDGLEDCAEDDTIEVISGLRRLMACRTVLFCYAARSGSMFQRLMTQELTVKFSLSLEDQMHDEEIGAYIIEELTRRKLTCQPGLLTDKLEKLVQKQLLDGAQGMYLWVALQLNSIFPNQSRTVVTREGIVNSIHNLPKDLPGTFERALEEIIDDRYGNTMMKIIMAAKSPLTLDELRVALTIIPGDPVWHAAKVPIDAPQLIALCGGNLLELDEEDGRVRFIHDSVMKHLLQTTENPRTRLYHFSIQEAEILAGGICVTFLNIPISDTAMTMTGKINGEQLAEKVIGAASRQQPLLSNIAQHFKKKGRHQSKSTEFDIGRLMAEIQAASVAKFDPRCFQDYASSNWLIHSQFFEKESPVCMKIWHLWVMLLCENVQVARTPFQNPTEEPWPALSWALMHHHNPLICTILEDPSTEPLNGETLSQGIVELTSSSPDERYDPSCLGLILTHLFQLAINVLLCGPNNEEDPFISDNSKTSESTRVWTLLYRSLEKLLDLGADPTIPHARNGNSIVKMLLTTLGHISEKTIEGLQLCGFLERVLIHKNAQLLLQFAWVPYLLRGILENDNIRAFSKLLRYKPEMHIQGQDDSLVGVAVARGNIEVVRALLQAWPTSGPSPSPTFYIHGRPAIHLALETQEDDIVILLTHHSSHTRFDMKRCLAPFLRIAVERMSAERVEFLLQQGADPNLGYSATIEESVVPSRFCYHLQVAAARNEIRKFLILVSHGADVFLPSFPSIGEIIARQGNLVLMAKLKEIEFFSSEDFLERTRLEHIWHELSPSALLEACRMLAEDVGEDQTFRNFGVRESSRIGMDAKRRELKRILQDLIRTTPSHLLNYRCREGNTTLHYLTGGMKRFHQQALDTASHLLTAAHTMIAECTRPWFALRNKYGQTPLHYAINNASKNSWSRPYLDSTSFILATIKSEAGLARHLAGNDNSILGFAISRQAPVDPVIIFLLEAGIDPNGTLKGATPPEVAMNMQSSNYAFTVTEYLLSCGTDPFLKCSNGGSLMDIVPRERREWLQDMLERLCPGQASETQLSSIALEHIGEPETITEGTSTLEDTSARGPLSLAAPISCSNSRPRTPGCWPRTRDSSPAWSDTSTRAFYGDTET